MLKLAAVQIEPKFGNVEENLERLCVAVRHAAREGARLIVLPELCDTGYMFESRTEALELASGVPFGDPARQLTEVAREVDAFVVAGLAERAQDRLFNSSALFGPDGLIGLFRKVHLWANENVIFDRGDLGFPVFDTSVGRIATFICYDGWFSESYRACALAGAQVICMPTNWVPIPGQAAGEPAMATILCRAAAHTNNVVVVAADRVGTERGQEFIGQSIIVSHRGWPIAGPASSCAEETLFAEVDLVAARKDRSWNDFNDPLLDRRPEVYLR